MPLIRREPAKPAEPAGADLRQAAAALRNGTAQERWQAARSLAAEPEAAGILGEALATERDMRVREAIFTSLTRLASAESVEAIIPHLRSDDAGLRAGALDALREMIGSGAAPLAGAAGAIPIRTSVCCAAIWSASCRQPMQPICCPRARTRHRTECLRRGDRCLGRDRHARRHCRPWRNALRAFATKAS